MKKVFKGFIVGFMILLMMGTCVYATSYSLRQSATVKMSSGSGKVYCTGTYYSTGSTRWSRSWTSSAGTLKSVYVSSSTFNVPNDKNMSTKGTIALIDYNYNQSSATQTFKYKFNGSKVVVGS